MLRVFRRRRDKQRAGRARGGVFEARLVVHRRFCPARRNELLLLDSLADSLAVVVGMTIPRSTVVLVTATCHVAPSHKRRVCRVDTGSGALC